MESELCFAYVGQGYAKPVTTVKCSICGEEVSWRAVVSHYMGHGKKSGSDMACPICNSKVKSQEYREHVRKHFAVKREAFYICGVCGKSFVSLKSLLIHIMKTHE